MEGGVKPRGCLEPEPEPEQELELKKRIRVKVERKSFWAGNGDDNGLICHFLLPGERNGSWIEILVAAVREKERTNHEDAMGAGWQPSINSSLQRREQWILFAVLD